MVRFELVLREEHSLSVKSGLDLKKKHSLTDCTCRVTEEHILTVGSGLVLGEEHTLSDLVSS
jgi:hypothetical protein